MVDALLADERKQYKVRAIIATHPVQRRKLLQTVGVEVVEGDLSDKDSLVKVRCAPCHASDLS